MVTIIYLSSFICCQCCPSIHYTFPNSRSTVDALPITFIHSIIHECRIISQSSIITNVIVVVISYFFSRRHLTFYLECRGLSHQVFITPPYAHLCTKPVRKLSCTSIFDSCFFLFCFVFTRCVLSVLFQLYATWVDVSISPFIIHYTQI